MNGQAAQNNPFRFSSEYTDDELGLIAYTHRFYNPLEGRWLSRDPAGEQSSPNLYCFVGNRPNAAVDFQGLVLYAIDGTDFNAVAPDEKDRKKGNVWHIYELSTYAENMGKQYFAGPDLVSVIERRRNQVRISVCDNYCYKGKPKIDFLGWSRGAAIAMDVSAFLKICGCPCTKANRTRDIPVDGLYLFDPVNRAWPGILKTGYIYDNVKFHVIVYDPDPDIIFNQVKPVVYSNGFEIPMNSYQLDRSSTHNDVGGNGLDNKDKNIASRAFMMEQMRQNGLEISQEDFSLQSTTYMDYNIDYSLPMPRINTVSLES